MQYIKNTKQFYHVYNNLMHLIMLNIYASIRTRIEIINLHIFTLNDLVPIY